ncbi:lipoprotein amino terminal region domain-containing protein [Ditylenchus destructor]|uniref:Lipoprotein amino terminal region domain-containing protein n=1 Tax=Ditylenchus destructor TaxID=166010 RepID=A0AAD4N876_9BILA|nr:lipoprotein amino terminal region domain-containing protein [Ditylenchus destructor]
MKATTLVALVLLAALCSASRHNNRRINDNDNKDSQRQSKQAKPFRSGYEYSFAYNGQISSGLDVSGPNRASVSSDEPQQKAVTRIQAEAKIAFESEQRATLQLEQIRVGQLNDQIESPQQVQPMGMFERKEIEEGKMQKLQLPLKFNYNQGVVEHIQFHADDAAWSKNIKRAVLNLIQLNLKKQPVAGNDEQFQRWATDDSEQQDEQDSQSGFQSFTLPEITIEGDCLTTYTANKRQSGELSDEQNDESEDRQQQESSSSQYFNVTKTIDFKKCKKQQQQSQTCPEECDPKEIKGQRLDRSTAMRFVLAGKGPQQEYGIKRAELVSQYVYKNLRSSSTAMQTVVAAELVFRSAKPQQQRHSFQPDSSNQKDTLLYDNEWDEEEKRFYMNGDEEFGRNGSPFSSVANKVDQVVKILRKVAQDALDKLNGLESRDAAKLHRAIELLRICSMPELKQIHEQIAEIRQSSPVVQKKAHQILADCLALAGTRNTIQMLTEKILSRDLDNQQAFQSLRQLNNLPAPSDKQADIVLRTCQHEVVHRSKALKQACWLTFGSMVGELCQQKTQNGEKTVPVFGAQSGFVSSQQCSSAKKEAFKQALLAQYRESQSTYEKVLALKALGNAGIDTAAQSLEKIVNSPQENRIVRVQAIDALRRLRSQMPRKIQRILLPVLQNTREHPAVRMSAFAMILHTTPERPILDQVAYTLNKERNPQVQAFAYSALKSLSESKVPCQQQMARQLKSVLHLTNVDEQMLQASRVYHIPIYSEQQKEGVFVNLISTFSHRNNILPNHLAAVVDTMFNDEFELNGLKVALTQQGLEQWYEGLIQSLLKGQSRSYQSKTRGQRTSTNPRENNEDELRQIFSGLKIKSRRSAYQNQQDDEEDNQQNRQRRQQKQPFAMITTRVGDVDTAILPIDSKTMPQCLKSAMNGQQISLAECLSSLQDPIHFNTMTAMNLIEKSAKVPTSMGVPLRILQAMPLLASVEGQIRATPDRTEGAGIKAQVKVHSIATAVHIQKMDIWTPMVTTGVEIIRAAELNAPVEAEIQVNSQGSFKFSMKPPTSRTRMLGLHSLPNTYALDFDSRTHFLKEAKVKTIQMPQYERFQQDVDEIVGSKHTGDLFRVQGHVHRPRNPTDYEQLLQMSMCTENHVHVKYEPENGPKEIIVRGQVSTFKKVSNMGPSLNIYTKDNEFDLMKDQDFEGSENHEQRRSKLNSFQSNFQSPMYKHELNLVLETKGGRKEHKAQVDTSATCDAKFQYCRLKVDMERTPLLTRENKEWTLRCEMEIVAPEAVSNVQQLRKEKYQTMSGRGELEWGNEQKESVKFRLHGESAKTKQWREQIDQIEGPQQKFQQKQTAFINKFDLEAEFKLDHQTQMKLYECFEYVKVYSGAGYWNSDVQSQQGRNGQIRGSAMIDPVTMQHVTVVVQTPTQVFRCENIQLSGKVRPFALVRPEQKSVHSISHMVNRLAVGNGRAECSVDGKRVETFDDVLYKAPIGKCYSVLAKDCSNENQPQFAVLMKTLNNGKDKKIKVITPEQVIECQPTKKSETDQKKLECSMNGQTIDATEAETSEQQDNYSAVQYNNDEQTDVTINVDGVQIRFGCWGSNGCKNQKAWIKLSSQYKEGQCGLCGHYDDQAGDEWRMANGQETDDLQQFHRSYSLRNQEDESQNDDDFTGAKLSRKNQKYDESSQQDEENEEEDSQWQAGAYHTDGSSSEEDQWGRQDSQKRQKMSMLKKKVSLKKKNQQKHGNAADQDDSEEPIQTTKVLEYGHQACFSVKPVKQCPRGTSPADEQQSDNAKFVCLNRSDPETRRMLQNARRGKIVDTSRLQPSSVNAIREPTRCIVY